MISRMHLLLLLLRCRYSLGLVRLIPPRPGFGSNHRGSARIGTTGVKSRPTEKTCSVNPYMDPFPVYSHPISSISLGDKTSSPTPWNYSPHGRSLARYFTIRGGTGGRHNGGRRGLSGGRVQPTEEDRGSQFLAALPQRIPCHEIWAETQGSATSHLPPVAPRQRRRSRAPSGCLISLPNASRQGERLAFRRGVAGGLGSDARGLTKQAKASRDCRDFNSRY
jgi:hypothetical protein